MINSRGQRQTRRCIVSAFFSFPFPMENFVYMGQYVQGHIAGILLCIVASIALGFMWHGPMFGKQWMKYNKMAPPKKSEMKFSMMVPGLVTSAITIFIQATVLGWATQEVPDIWLALWLAAVIWLPFSALTIANIYVWSAKPKGLIFLDAGFSLLSMLITTAILFAMM